ncbi:MAG: peptide deformylase [Eubacterium sp.]|nr:peptide deformylase [Eubacterium sp.]
MAIRNIRVYPDEILRKPCKKVKEVNDKLKLLIQDMFDTMYHADGVGLAAPQVGILKRLAVVDVSEEQDQPIVMINPEILETSGEQRGLEGCLSVPEKAGIVTRPNYVKVKAYNENMEEVILEGEELLARALIHEIEHLDGHMYVEVAEEGKLYDPDEVKEVIEREGLQ